MNEPHRPIKQRTIIKPDLRERILSMGVKANPMIQVYTKNATLSHRERENRSRKSSIHSIEGENN